MGYCVTPHRTFGVKMSVYKQTADNHPIFARIGEAAMYEQLAEEAAELAHSALKMARVLRQENPTPVKKLDAKLSVQEEFTDVFQCAEELNISYSRKQIRDKTKRFMERWDQCKCEGTD